MWLRGHKLLIIVFNLTPVLSEVGQFTPAELLSGVSALFFSNLPEKQPLLVEFLVISTSFSAEFLLGKHRNKHYTQQWLYKKWIAFLGNVEMTHNMFETLRGKKHSICDVYLRLLYLCQSPSFWTIDSLPTCEQKHMSRNT